MKRQTQHQMYSEAVGRILAMQKALGAALAYIAVQDQIGVGTRALARFDVEVAMDAMDFNDRTAMRAQQSTLAEKWMNEDKGGLK